MADVEKSRVRIHETTTFWNNYCIQYCSLTLQGPSDADIVAPGEEEGAHLEHHSGEVRICLLDYRIDKYCKSFYTPFF